MKRMRKLFATLLALALLLGMIGTAGAEAPEKITMLFSAGGSGKAITAAAERFTQETGIQAEVLLFTIDEVYEKQVLSLSNGNNDIDIVAINDPWVPLLKNYLVPLNDLDPEFLGAFVPGMLDTFTADGNIYGIPVRMGSDVITYRKDIFAEKGIDINTIKTWEDLYNVAVSLTDKENSKYGWAMGIVEPSNVFKAWFEYMICYGARILNEDGSAFAFNSPEGIAATKMFVKFVQDACPPDILNYSFNDQIDAMKTGNAAMGLLWTSRYASVNASDGEYTGQFAVLPWMPSGDGVDGIACVDGWAVGISQSSSHKEAARKFIEYIGSYDEQLRLATQNSNSPTIASIYESEEYLSVIPEAANMNEAMKVAEPRPAAEFFTEVQDSVALYVKRACMGDMTVEDALAACQAECDKILEDYR